MTLLSELPFVFLSYFIGDAIDKTSPNEFALVLGNSDDCIFVTAVGEV